MTRLILLTLFAWLLFSLLRKLMLPRPGGTRPGAPATPLVRCAHCGVYVPPGESVTVGDRTFCCREHQRAAEQPRPDA
jgi:uncharacterized protein